MMKLCDLQGLNCNVCMHPWWSCVISRDSTAMCVCIHDEAVLSLGAQLQCIYASMMKLCDLQWLNCNVYVCIHDEAVWSPGTQLQHMYIYMHPWWSCVISRDSTAMCVCTHDEAVWSPVTQLQCIYICIHDEAVLSQGAHWCTATGKKFMLSCYKLCLANSNIVSFLLSNNSHSWCHTLGSKSIAKFYSKAWGMWYVRCCRGLVKV